MKEERGKIKSVITEDGREFTADIFVGNADLPYIYQELLPESTEAKKLGEDKLYTCSTIMFYWGVDKEYPQIAHHNVFLGGDYQASFHQIFNDHTLPEVPSFYVHAPARTDKESAPKGQDTLYVLVPVGHLDARSKQNWEALVNRARKTVFARLAKEMGAEDLREHIKFEIAYGPEVWKERYARNPADPEAAYRYAQALRATGQRAQTAAVLATLSVHEWRVSSLVRMSTEEPMAALARASDLEFAFVHREAHYDGVYFYAIALDPFGLDPEVHERIDRYEYRYGHAGYAWLAGFFGFGDAGRLPWSMLAVSLVGMGVAGWAVSRTAQELGRSGWWGLTVAFNPGLVFSVTVLTSDPGDIEAVTNGEARVIQI